MRKHLVVTGLLLAVTFMLSDPSTAPISSDEGGACEKFVREPNDTHDCYFFPDDTAYCCFWDEQGNWVGCCSE